MKRAFLSALRLYAAACAVVLSVLVSALAAGLLLGRPTPEELSGLARAGLPRPALPWHGPVEAEEVSASGSAAEPARPERPGPREIERAVEDLRRWEERLEALGSDLEQRLAATDERQRGWDRMRGSMVALLNHLLEDSPGWKPLAEDDLLAADSAGLLDRLRAREEALDEASRSLKDLPPGVLAGILATGLKPMGLKPGRRPGSAHLPDSRAALEDAEAVRLLASLEPARLARVFRALHEEDPARAAALLALMVRGGARRETGGEEGAPRP